MSQLEMQHTQSVWQDIRPNRSRSLEKRFSEDFIEALRRSMERSFDDLEPFREQMRELVREYAGHRYGNNGASQEILVNNINTQVETFTYLLAANNPRVAVSTKVAELRSLAADWEVVSNNNIELLNLGAKIRRWLKDAMFSIGIIKTGIAITDKDYLIDDEAIPETEVFAQNVSLDNWVFDTLGRQYEGVRYAADYYTVRIDVLERMGVPWDVLTRLHPTHGRTTPFSKDGDTLAEITLDSYDSGETDLYPRVGVWDVWLPHEGVILTIPDGPINEVLRVAHWKGRRNGPYRLLGFSEVPENVMPAGVAQFILDLHLLLNEGYRKLARQARRQKTNPVLPKGNESDGQNWANANDGETLYASDPKSLNTVISPGPDQGNLAFAIHLDDRLSRQAGNLDALAGLGPQADTLGQERMIQGTLSGKLNKMSQVLLEATTELIQDLDLLWWTDPTRVYEGMRPMQIPGGLNLGVPIGPELAGVGPQHREKAETWFQLNFKVVPYSMRYRSPEEKIGEIEMTLDRMAPFLPLMQEQGLAIDFERLIALEAQMRHLPELLEIITFQHPTRDARTMMQGDPPVQIEPQTKRTYEHINRPGGTRQGRDEAMFHALLGKPPQPAQGAALVRPVQ